MKHVGERIKHYRLLRGLDQEKVAEQLGKSQSFVSQIETGKIKPSLKKLEQIANILNITPGALLCEKYSCEHIFEHFDSETKAFLAKEKSKPFVEFARELKEMDVPVDALEPLLALVRILLKKK